MLIYWLLFIYLSLSGMDEIIELFSTINQLEKGALGLFFEMNYFVGVFLACYIAWFNITFDAPKAADEKNKDDFNKMYNWLFFHYIYLFFSIVISFMVYCVYKTMDNKASTKTKPSSDDDKNED